MCSVLMTPSCLINRELCLCYFDFYWLKAALLEVFWHPPPRPLYQFYSDLEPVCAHTHQSLACVYCLQRNHVKWPLLGRVLELQALFKIFSHTFVCFVCRHVLLLWCTCGSLELAQGLTPGHQAFTRSTLTC